jgi:hypothetical protein
MMRAPDPSELQNLLGRSEELTGSLSASTQLSADVVLDLTIELTKVAQQATLGLELEGDWEAAARLRRDVARAVREAAANRPDDERSMLEPIADFWDLTASAQRADGAIAQSVAAQQQADAGSKAQAGQFESSDSLGKPLRSPAAGGEAQPGKVPAQEAVRLAAKFLRAEKTGESQLPKFNSRLK